MLITIIELNIWPFIQVTLRMFKTIVNKQILDILIKPIRADQIKP